MRTASKAKLATILLTAGMIGVGCGPAAAEALDGQVFAGGQPVAGSDVTLWAAGSGAPQQLAQTRTAADGHFAFASIAAPGPDASLYLLAKGGHSAADKTSGDNPALALMTVVGAKPPSHVTINEMATIASVWTHAQFFDGAAIKGHALGLRIAAGRAARTAKSAARAIDLAPIIADIKTTGASSLREIAAELNGRGIPTARGGEWSAVQVQRVMNRASM